MGAVYNFPGYLYLVISKCEERVGFRGKVIKKDTIAVKALGLLMLMVTIRERGGL